MRKAGYAIWSTLDGQTEERDLLQCCHCQMQWYLQPGSGNTRGWCASCAAPTCGAVKCRVCAPFLKKLERQLARQALLQAIGR